MIRFAIVGVLVACGGRIDVESVDAAADAITKKDAGSNLDAPIGDDATPTFDPLCTAPTNAATNGSCVTIDGTNTTCNPVTNFGCDGGAGEACDLGGGSTFQCFPAPNDVALCGACDNQNGPFCKPTMHCAPTASGSGCARFCCDDTDCTGGKCDTSLLGQPPGVCVK